jgi:predicted ArsR family transcriptional regulator
MDLLNSLALVARKPLMAGEERGPAGASRDLILALLRRGSRTVDELSSEVGITANSIRVQLAVLERDGLVQRDGVRRRARKPATLYALTADAERSFSNAYVPVLATLLQVVGDRVGPQATERILAEVGRRLGDGAARTGAAPAARLRDALDLLAALGGIAEVEQGDERIVVRGLGCPLAEVVRKDPRVCLAMQSLLSQVTGAAVRESCDRADRPACRFTIAPADRAA